MTVYSSFITHALGATSEKPLPNSRLQRFTLMSHSKSFTIVGPTCESLMYFVLIFVYGGREGSTSFFYIWLSVRAAFLCPFHVSS